MQLRLIQDCNLSWRHAVSQQTTGSHGATSTRYILLTLVGQPSTIHLPLLCFGAWLLDLWFYSSRTMLMCIRYQTRSVMEDCTLLLTTYSTRMDSSHGVLLMLSWLLSLLFYLLHTHTCPWFLYCLHVSSVLSPCSTLMGDHYNHSEETLSYSEVRGLLWFQSTIKPYDFLLVLVSLDLFGSWLFWICWCSTQESG